MTASVSARSVRGRRVQTEVRGGEEQVAAAALVRGGIADHRGRLRPERQPVLRLRGAHLVLRIVGRPLAQRDHPPPGSPSEVLAGLDRLGEDDLLLGGEQGDPPDLAQVEADGVVYRGFRRGAAGDGVLGWLFKVAVRGLGDVLVVGHRGDSDG